MTLFMTEAPQEAPETQNVQVFEEVYDQKVGDDRL